MDWQDQAVGTEAPQSKRLGCGMQQGPCLGSTVFSLPLLWAQAGAPGVPPPHPAPLFSDNSVHSKTSQEQCFHRPLFKANLDQSWGGCTVL